jgi:hypothetical protein
MAANGEMTFKMLRKCKRCSKSCPSLPLTLGYLFAWLNRKTNLQYNLGTTPERKDLLTRATEGKSFPERCAKISSRQSRFNRSALAETIAKIPEGYVVQNYFWKLIGSVGGRNILVLFLPGRGQNGIATDGQKMAKFFNLVFERFDAFGFQAEIIKFLSKIIFAGWCLLIILKNREKFNGSNVPGHKLPQIEVRCANTGRIMSKAGNHITNIHL